MEHDQETSSQSLAKHESNHQEVVLITGANKGIGREIARQLGKQDMTVLVSARSEERGTEATEALRDEGIDARFVELDVTDETTIEAAAATIEREFGHLDVLVNNAGIQFDEGLPSENTPEVMRQTYEVNVFGIVAVTNAMLPLLRKVPAARIVNISSDLGSLAALSDPDRPNTGLMAYNSSKAAVNAVTVIYANELRDVGILVNAVTPGFTETDLHGLSGGHSVEEGAKAPVRAATLSSDGPTGHFVGQAAVFDDFKEI